MALAEVKKHFDGEAADYDAIIRACIPGYAEQNEILAELIPQPLDAELSVLDLGAGNGVLTETILTRYPRAHAVVFDFSENMLTEAGKRLQPFASRIVVRLGDFGHDDIGCGYDLIVSGLAIHHLEDAGKRALFKRIFDALRPGGTLLVRDVVLGATQALTARYIELWTAFMRRNGLDAVEMLAKYRREDIPAPMETQLRWLAEAGFMDVDCHWRRMNFAVFGGRKPD